MEFFAYPVSEIPDAAAQKKVSKRVPKGTSEYQASWIIDSEEESGEEEDEDDDDDDDLAVEVEDGSESDTSMVCKFHAFLKPFLSHLVLL